MSEDAKLILRLQKDFIDKSRRRIQVVRGTPEQAFLAVEALYPRPEKGEIIEDKGETVCGYKTSKLLGSGAYGKVYSTVTDKAIKIVDKSSGKYGVHYEPLNEVLYMSQISSPYVVKPTSYKISCGEQDKMAIIMPLASGSLASLKDNEEWNFDWQSIDAPGIKALRFKLAHDILCGISDMHNNGIMHLDLKPANILLYRTPRKMDKFGIIAEIGDFGLAQHIIGRRSRKPNEIVSAWYRDPRLSCELDTMYNQSVDIWSFGIILLFIFFNKDPPYKDYNGDDGKNVSEMYLSWLKAPDRFKEEINEASRISEESENLHWCKKILDLQQKMKIKIPTTVEQWLDNNDYFRNVYYTHKEYYNILDTIDACLDYTKFRTSAKDLLKMPLFNHPDFTLCSREPLKMMSLTEKQTIIDSLGLLPHVANLAKFFVRKIKDSRKWPIGKGEDIMAYVALNLALKYFGYNGLDDIPSKISFPSIVNEEEFILEQLPDLMDNFYI